MNRSEAVRIIKEILGRCSAAGNSLKLMPPDADSVLSDGFQIHIKVPHNGFERECVSKIADKNRLKIKEEGLYLIIYRSCN